MEHKCEKCNKSYNNKESLEQHNLAKHANEKHKKINFKKYFITIAIGLTILLLVLSVNNYIKNPGKYDNFAKCLLSRGAVIYGNDFCSYTNQQLNFFGKSKKYLNYVKCIENEALCNEKGVDTTPTWEINGQMYEQVQTFEKLSAITGCEI